MTFVLDIRTATPHFPGIGRYIAGLVPALAAQLTNGEQLMLLCNDATQIASFSHVLNIGAEVATCRVQATPFSLSQQWQVSLLLQQLSKDLGKLVYHSPYYLMPYWLGVPTVLTVHDIIPILLPETVSARARLLFRFAHHMALKAAEQIIAVSGATATDLCTVFDVDPVRVSVVPHGVDPRFHPQSLAEIARVRANYGLPDEFIFYLGINKPHKNLVNLVQAFALLPIEMPTLVIAGAWDSRYPEAIATANRLGMTDRVRFLGPIEDSYLPALYSAATLFVFPSRYEGFGLPVLEAMACGTPVVSSNTSSIPEVAGSAATLVDPNDFEQLALALRTLLVSRDLREYQREAGLTRARMFSWEVCARKTLDVYRGTRNIL